MSASSPARDGVRVAAFVIGLRAEATEYMVRRYLAEPTREHAAAVEWHARGLANFALEQSRALEALTTGGNRHAS